MTPPVSTGIHFAPIATHAQGIGRRKLALMLLDEETSCSLQVPLLLSLSRDVHVHGSNSVPPVEGVRSGVAGASVRMAGDDENDVLLKALRKAIESGDTDLVRGWLSTLQLPPSPLVAVPFSIINPSTSNPPLL